MVFTPLAELYGDRLLTSGAGIEWVSASQIRIGKNNDWSVLRDQTNRYTIRFFDFLTADLTASGPGGIDIGSEAADTWYSVWVIANSNSPGRNQAQVILSTSMFAPLLVSPLIFDVYRRVGWIRNDASSNILMFRQYGQNRDRLWFYETNKGQTQTLVGGSATTFTTVSLAAFAPPTSVRSRLRLDFEPQNGGNEARIRPTGSTINDPNFGIVGSRSARISSSIQDVPTDAMQQIDYEVDQVNDALDIYVAGFHDII